MRQNGEFPDNAVPLAVISMLSERSRLRLAWTLFVFRPLMSRFNQLEGALAVAPEAISKKLLPRMDGLVELCAKLTADAIEGPTAIVAIRATNDVADRLTDIETWLRAELTRHLLATESSTPSSS